MQKSQQASELFRRTIQVQLFLHHQPKYQISFLIEKTVTQ